MKMSTNTLAGLAIVATIAGGAATAQAHPAQAVEHAAAHHTSSVALTRLHDMIHAPSAAANRGFRPNDGGSPSH
ncbi:MAG TPA: hypothetical protein VIJ28_09770 [Chloroflexota bacterium]|jgi:hypothetical protein